MAKDFSQIKAKAFARNLSASLAGLRAGGAMAIDQAMHKIAGDQPDAPHSEFAQREAKRFVSELALEHARRVNAAAVANPAGLTAVALLSAPERVVSQDELVEQGTFADLAEAERMIQDFEALHADPTRDDLAKSLGVGETLLDEDVRTLEVRNWLDEHTPLENPPGRTR